MRGGEEKRRRENEREAGCFFFLGNLKKNEKEERKSSLEFFSFSLSLSLISTSFTKCEAFWRRPREYDAASPSSNVLAQREQLCSLPLQPKRATIAPKASATTKMRFLHLLLLERPSSRRRPRPRRPPPSPCSGSRARSPTLSCAGCSLEGSPSPSPASRRSSG